MPLPMPEMLASLVADADRSVSIIVAFSPEIFKFHLKLLIRQFLIMLLVAVAFMPKPLAVSPVKLYIDLQSKATLFVVMVGPFTGFGSAHDWAALNSELSITDAPHAASPA